MVKETSREEQKERIVDKLIELSDKIISYHLEGTQQALHQATPQSGQELH